MPALSKINSFWYDAKTAKIKLFANKKRKNKQFLTGKALLLAV